MRRARGLILALGMQALRSDRMRNRRAGRDRQRKRTIRCRRTNRLASLILAAVLVAGAEGAWTQAFADPGDAVPDSSIPPAAPAEAGTGRPGTERLGTALDRIAKEDPLLAKVNGQEIRWTDIVESARGRPESYRSQVEVIFPALLERLIDLRLIIWAAREAGLREDAEVRRQVAEFEDRLISETLIQREIADRITTEMVRARYDAYAARLAASAEVRARHILLDSEEDAVEAIAALDAGADFAELARVRSLGPTAEQGGDLDYFTRGNMTPKFAEAAFGLDAGEYSRTPVKTEFGWHVIKVEDRRAQAPAGFFEKDDQLREEITRELMVELLRGLRARAEIDLYPGVQRMR